MRDGLTHRSLAASDGIDEKRTEIYYWWLLVAIFFEYARPGSFVPGIAVLKLNSLIPLSLLVAVLVAKGLRPWDQIFSDRGSRWMTAYIGLALISIPFAAVKVYALSKFTDVLGYFFLFLIIARVATSVRRLYGIFGSLVVAHLFLIVMSPELISNTEVRSYVRGATFLGDGNDFALSACLLLPMTLALALGARGRLARLLAWASVSVFLLAIVGTQSRGATLGIIAVAGYLWLGSKRKLVSMLGILLAGAVISFHASDTYFSRMSTIQNYQQDESAEGRIIAWKASMRMAADNPLFGVGLGNFPTEFGSKYRPKNRAMPWMTAHSTYFLVLGELGPPGLVVLLALVLGAILSLLALKRRLIEANPDPPRPEVNEATRLLTLLVASTIGFGVPGAFLSAAYYPHLFVLTGILVSARCIASGLLPANADGSRQGAVRRRTGHRPVGTGQHELQKIPRILHMNSARDEQADSWMLILLRRRGSSPAAT